MKPYMHINKKGKWSYFWDDKVSKKIKRIFKKSARQDGKKEAEQE